MVSVKEPFHKIFLQKPLILGEPESPQQSEVLLQSVALLSLKCLAVTEMLVNQKQLIEDLGPLAKNPHLDNNQYQEDFVDTFLPIQYSFSCSVESPGVCFVIGISGNRKIHFANQLQDPRELLLRSIFFLILSYELMKLKQHFEEKTVSRESAAMNLDQLKLH